MIHISYNDKLFHLSYDIGRGEVFNVAKINKVKILNIISVIMSIVSTLCFIRLVQKEGIEQVSFSLTIMYALAIVLLIVNIGMYQINKRNEDSNLQQ